MSNSSNFIFSTLSLILSSYLFKSLWMLERVLKNEYCQHSSCLHYHVNMSIFTNIFFLLIPNLNLTLPINTYKCIMNITINHVIKYIIVSRIVNF